MMKTVCMRVLGACALLTCACLWSPVEENGGIVERNGWRFEEGRWSVGSNTLTFKGGLVDAVAWYTKEFRHDLSVQLRFKASRHDRDTYQMLFILFGNQSFGSDSWKNGIIINYEIGRESKQSVVKRGGMSEGFEYIVAEPSPPDFPVEMPHTVTITLKNDTLDVTIDGTPLHRDVYVSPEDTVGYFGVASHWQYGNQFEITDITFPGDNP